MKLYPWWKKVFLHRLLMLLLLLCSVSSSTINPSMVPIVSLSMLYSISLSCSLWWSSFMSSILSIILSLSSSISSALGIKWWENCVRLLEKLIRSIKLDRYAFSMRVLLSLLLELMSIWQQQSYTPCFTVTCSLLYWLYWLEIWQGFTWSWSICCLEDAKFHN